MHHLREYANERLALGHRLGTGHAVNRVYDPALASPLEPGSISSEQQATK